ncbi:MAG: carboxypeptidase-like regulatory domain-containing protein [Vicinamibacterales bacterium]
MTRLSLFIVGSLAVLIAPLLLAQSPPAPGRGAAAGPPKATALIIGQVLDASTGQPISDAIVTLTGGRGAGPAGAARGPATPQRVMTGADGRFVFHELLPGQFQLSAGLKGYTGSLNAPGVPAGVSAAGSAAAAAMLAAVATTTGPTTTIAVEEGEVVAGIRLRLWKTAVVSGTVVDDGGEPAIGIMVQVARRVMTAGRARYLPGAAARTDDRGMYRISSLVPGDYLVVVPQTQTSIPTAILTGLMGSMTGSGSPGGGLALLDLATSGVNPNDALAGGVRVGDYMVASGGSVPLSGADGRLLAYQTLFYPGVDAPAQASILSLGSGDDRTGLNFQLRLIPTLRVTGAATGPEGPLANLGVRLVAPADGAGNESEFDVATTVTRPDGTFTFHGVPPGPFLLRAQKQPRPPMSAGMAAGSPLMEMMFGGGAAGPPAEALYGSMSVTVSSADVDNVGLRLAPGLHAAGRIVFDSASGRPAPPPNQIQTLTVTLTPMDGQSGGGLSGMSQPDRANAQGEFRTRGYAAGRYFLSIANAGNWQVRSATLNGRDVLDAPLDLRDDATGIVVTMADELAQLSGTVTSRGETDLSETSVYLVPADYRAWITAGMNPRRARTVRAGRTGSYAMANVPAGEYFAAAIDRADEGDVQDPAFIEVLSRIGTRVVVGVTPRTLDLAKTRVRR